LGVIAIFVVGFFLLPHPVVSDSEKSSNSAVVLCVVVLCIVKVAYNEFDVTLPVAKRVQYLVRKVRDVIAQDSGSSKSAETQVVHEAKKERKINISVSSAAATSRHSGGYLRKLLRSDDFLASDEEHKITQDSRDSSLQSCFPESSSKRPKQKTRQKKAKSLDAQIGLTDAPAARPVPPQKTDNN